MRVSAWRVREALSPCLGPVAGDETLCRKVAEKLSAFRWQTERLADLALAVQQLLFNELYRLLGYRMSYRRADRSERRIMISELPELSDRALEPLMDSLPVGGAAFLLLRSYAMDSGSVSAMRVLCGRFGAYLDEDERALMERIIRENRPDT